MLGIPILIQQQTTPISRYQRCDDYSITAPTSLPVGVLYKSLAKSAPIHFNEVSLKPNTLV